jgi:hypothetical protein
VVHYQQSDSLSTATDVPLAGTGTSTPQAPAGNADYSAWQWEAVLASVLSIPVPDRSEVTGRPWLTVGHDGQGGGGSHLIWTAGWDASKNSGATSIEVYLDPALYTVGGAWDRFTNSPPQALSQVLSRQYDGLLLVPPSFAGASVAMDNATSFWVSAAEVFGMVYDSVASGSDVGFQGNVAGVAGDLFNRLRTTAVSICRQLTEPVNYSDSIAAAGQSASTFLTDVLSAYSSWTHLTEHSPLGAVVTVLERIATPEPGGGYVIPDPQNSPYGDLTIDSSWAVVEQHAKNLWTGTLTGGSGDFAGLDQLGRAALNKMVSQFAATTNAVVPVVGPAPPIIKPNPVNPNVGNGGSGHGNPPPPGRGGGAGSGFKAPPNRLASSSGLGGPNHPGGSGGSGGSRGSGGSGGPGGSGGIGGDAGFVAGGAGGSAEVLPGGDPSPVLAPTDSALISDAPALGAGSTFAGSTNFAASADDEGGSRSPVAGSPPGDSSASDLLAELGQPGFIGQPGLTGGIGRPETDGASEESRSTGVEGRPERAKERSAGKRLKAPVPGYSLGRGGGVADGKEAVSGGPLKAPVAGFSLGRDPGGVVLQQSVVPTIAAKPPAVTSSVINLQPVQASGGTNLAPAGPPAGGPPPDAPVTSTQAPAESSPVLIGDGGPFGPGMVGANQALGVGGTDVEGRMAMPPMGLGGLGGAGSGFGGGQRKRLSYLPQEERFWGTEPELATSLRAAAGDDDVFEAPGSDAVPGRIAGIGAGSEIEEHEDAATDWKIR